MLREPLPWIAHCVERVSLGKEKTAVQEVSTILERHPFLTAMSPSQLTRLKDCGATRQYQPGDYITRAGRPANEFYLIDEGQVALETNVPLRGGLRLETLRPGDVIGWSWLIEPYKWLFDSRVLKPTTIVALNGARLRAECQNDHELGYQLLLRVTSLIEQRLQATQLQLLDTFQPAAPQ